MIQVQHHTHPHRTMLNLVREQRTMNLQLGNMITSYDESIEYQKRLELFDNSLKLINVNCSVSL